jgi:dipeptidyl aminopeptidase/acylaminoacyl peptidase
MNCSRPLLSTLVYLLTVQIGYASAQPAALPVRSLLTRVEYSSEPIAVSFSGDWVAYTVRDVERSSSLRVVQVATGETVGLLPDSSTWGGVWSPAGTTLAFLAQRDGHTQLWLWDPESRRSREAIPDDVGPDPPQWSADGSKILVSLPEGSTPSTSVTPVVGQGALGVTVRNAGVAFAASDAPPAPVMTRRFGLIDLAIHRVIHLATAEASGAYRLSPDGAAIALSIMLKGGEPVPRGSRSDLAILQLQNNRLRRVATAVAGSILPVWSPSSAMIAFCPKSGDGGCAVVDVRDGQSRRFDPPPGESFVAAQVIWAASSDTMIVASPNALWAVDVHGGARQPITHLAQRHILWIVPARRAAWEVDEPPSLCVATVNDATLAVTFERIDIKTGRSITLATADMGLSPGTVAPIAAASGGDTFVALLESFDRPPDLWTGSVAQGGLRQLTHLNPALESYPMGANRLVEWRDKNARSHRAQLILPTEYRPGERYPLLVTLYPGGMGSEKLHAFSATAVPLQLYTTRGYVVLQPDVPLSTGNTMHDIASAVLPAIEHVVALGIADAHRVGVVGASFGGYAAMALIVQSTQLQAAVSIDGLDNMINPYMQPPGAPAGNPWVRDTAWALGGHMGGSLWEARDRYINNSPLFFFDRITAPVLLIHGAADGSIPVGLAQQSFNALRDLGKRATFVTYGGAGHGWTGWSLPQQIDMNERVLAWFDQYLRGLK